MGLLRSLEIRSASIKPNGTKTAPKLESGELDLGFLEGLLGYNARRTAVRVIHHFLEETAEFGVRPVEFSVLSTLYDNPGATARQICKALELHAPNLVGIVSQFEQRQLVTRKTLDGDRRAQGLWLTAKGRNFAESIRQKVLVAEAESASALSAKELAQVITLLQRVYRPKGL